MPIRFSGPAMYKLFIAFRYLRRNWLNLVGMLAVALGVMVPICVLSVMKGFDEEFRSRIRATLSDLIVERRTDDPFGGYEEMMARIEKMPHVVAFAPEYEGLALLKAEAAVRGTRSSTGLTWRARTRRRTSPSTGGRGAGGRRGGVWPRWPRRAPAWAASRRRRSRRSSHHAPRGLRSPGFRGPRGDRVLGGAQQGGPFRRVPGGRKSRPGMGAVR